MLWVKGEHFCGTDLPDVIKANEKEAFEWERFSKQERKERFPKETEGGMKFNLSFRSAVTSHFRFGERTLVNEHL